MPHIQILVDTADHFVAENPPYSFPFFRLIIIVVFIGFLTYYFRQREWKAAAILIPIGAFLVWSTLSNGIAYRMDLKPQEHVLLVQTVKKGKIIESQTIPFSDIARAEMQFNRGDKRIVVVLNNGQEVFPLGDGYIQNDPNQYIPLVAIQKAVGLPASSDSDKGCTK